MMRSLNCAMARSVWAACAGVLLVCGVAAAQPATPSPQLPGHTASPGSEVTTLTPLFMWTASTGAAGYGLYIRDMNTNSLVYDNDFVPNQAFLTLPSGVLQEGRNYRWNVRARNSAGQWSAFSSPLYFYTQSQSSPTI